jgi:nucleotide-binding universal stress UspA family protein
MSHVLAAVDDSAATTPVIAVAQWFGRLLDLEVVALHVTEDGSGATARAAADAAGVKVEVREGDPSRTILQAATDDNVLAIVMGARGLPADRVPAGHVALDVIRRVAKPVIVVPPDVRVPAGGRPLRLLAPVDDERPSADALRRSLDAIPTSDVELVLLHVFDAQHIPMFADHGSYDIDEWCNELVRRTTPSHEPHARVEWRVGHPAHTILAVERELEPDLLMLAWAGDLSRGRAAVVKRLLAHATTPVLLVPVVEAARMSAPTAGRRSPARSARVAPRLVPGRWSR